MNNTETKYTQFALAREMLQTADVVRNFDVKAIDEVVANLKDKVLLSGEGSSRIFPAKNTLYRANKKGYAQRIFTEGATQALEYKLDDATVFVASNSGKTKEGVRLIRKLKAEGHKSIVGIVAHEGTPIVAEADYGYVLTCGNEDAVAATKSVVEQALFTDLVFRKANGSRMPDLKKLGDAIEEVLTMKVPEEIVSALANAPVLYWAGRNNGVAEELRLKTNEITRKKSDYLEGTYAAHGIEEVMRANEAIIVVDPFEQEEEKFDTCLRKGVGLPIVAISTRKTSFPTMIIPDVGCPSLETYVQLCAGWSLLMEVGLANNINLDKPERARKVGNEFVG
ncbi:MAG: SIS domain-containing protein [Fibrobacterales bacterium]|nr:SIS domain-containing protein [Fibrobacterales bacterium]